MKKLILPAFLAAILGLAACTVKPSANVKVSDLRCEYRVDPVGIDAVQPRLSWVPDSPKRAWKQSAYRILAASSRELLDKDQGELWDSGKVTSDQTCQVAYAGKALDSGKQCFWKVCVWDKDGKRSAYSPVASWSMGLLGSDDWTGQWIGLHTAAIIPPSKADSTPPGPPPAWLRKEFSLDKPVRRATAFATARGVFELSLNGAPVSPDLFAPEWTDYRKRIQYRAWDITSLVKPGANAVGTVLGDGWFSGYLGWYKTRSNFGEYNCFIARIEVEYEDGSTQTITTDSTWRAAAGPILSSDIQMGESYDARREMPGWDSPGFDDSGWSGAETFEKPSVPLVAQPSEPIRVTDTLTPLAMFQPRPGVYVFDMGQNFAGRARLKVQGEAGTRVVIRYAERLNPDSTIYTTNLRSARATDTYVLKGGGEETWEPRFTFHGFQYVELTGYPGVPTLESITGRVLHSDTPPAGKFECSDPLVNRLWENALWSQRGNFISIPTDCPQRDERLGWMGDAQIFIRTASCNMDVAAFFNKWMWDVEDGQSEAGAFSEISPRFPPMVAHYGAAGWGDAGVIVPWTIYRVYGDTRIIEQHYDSMARWLAWIGRNNPNFIRWNERGSDYGDWLSIGADTPKDLLATAYWAYDAQIMSKMADVIGRAEDSRKYAELFQNIRTAFQKDYVSADGTVLGDTQTGYLLALYMDLLPENLRQSAAEHLVNNIRQKDWHLSTGFLGVRQLNLVLTSMGYSDIAWRLLETRTFPSWLYPVTNGATTIWERWDGWTAEKGFQTPEMNSFNHYSLGSVSEWLYRCVAGIDLDPDVPAFQSFVIRPYPGGGMEFARAEFQSIRGRIASGWSVKGDTLSLDVTVPANTSARIFVPCAEGASVTEGGAEVDKSEGVAALGREKGCAVYALGSGTYSFRSRMPR